MNRNGRLCLLLGDSLTAFLLLAGSLLSWFAAYEIAADRAALLLAGALLAPLWVLLWSWPRGHWPALGLLALGGLALWRLWTKLQSAGAAPDLRALLALPEAQLLLEALLGLAVGWVVVRARCWYLAALLVNTPVLPAILAGVLPDWPALLAAAAGWLGMLLAAFYSRRDPASLGRGVLVSLGAAGALLALLAAVLPMEDYERPRWATDARSRLLTSAAEQAQRLKGDLDWELPPFMREYLVLDGTGGGSAEGSGGGAVFSVSEEGTVDLLAAGPRRYAGRTVLEVAGGTSGRIYLRGGGAGVYTGSGWEAVDEGDYTRLWERTRREAGGWSDPVTYPSFRQGSLAVRELTIRPVSPTGSTIYYPYYFLTWTAEDYSGQFRSSGSLRDALSMREGTVSSREPVESYRVLSMEGPRAGEEEALSPLADGLEQVLYRDFVYSHYLDVPRATRAALAPLLEEAGRVPIQWPAELPEPYQEPAAAARRTAVALADAARYDLSAPAMEPGEDFIAHFLEQGRGYCVHFATAGALLLRMQGIPARYVSGYVADLDESGYAAVLDSAAHAWVEIYLDGFGWYPVEMTPAYGAAPEETPQAPEEYPEEAPPSPETPEPPETPDAPEEPPTDAPDAPEEPPTDAPDTPEEPGQESLPADTPLDLRWLKWAGLALALAAVPLGLYRLALVLRRRSRRQPDANRSAIAAYRRSLRLSAWGGGEDPALTDLARKAKFSQHTLTEAEREAAWQSLEDLFRRTRGDLPRWKRPLLGLLRPLF